MVFGHTLERSPLAPSVPLDGSDTVAGLRTLERLRASNLLPPNNGPSTSSRAPPTESAWASRRRKYQRFKGPFIEHLTVDDMKKNPKPWNQFTINGENGRLQDAYNVPATLDILAERFEENIATYLPNYLRLALLVIMLTFYLRPIALFGAISLAASMYLNLTRVLQEQQNAALEQAHRNAGRSGGPTFASSAAVGSGFSFSQNHQDPTQQLGALFLTLITWFLVAYTRCLPIVILALALAGLTVSMHAALRRAPSEYRYKGKSPIGWTIDQVLGRRMVPQGEDARLVFRQAVAAMRNVIRAKSVAAARYAKYYMLCALDAVKAPFSRRASSAWS